MQIKIGPVVKGENFYNRPQLIDGMWDAIESESNILLVAPRRVGKTSLMYYIIDHPKKSYQFIFLNTESVNNVDEFFKKLLSKLLTSDFISSKDKYISLIKEHVPGIKKIGTSGIEFSPEKILDYYQEFINIIDKLNMEDEKLVIMLDEFSQTVENIKNDEGEKNALQFLHLNRELRQEHLDGKNVQFIYTGSIGLEHVVSRINASKTINDLLMVI